jgi:Rod binding domain-containing protein
MTNISADTSIAVMQASQGQTSNALAALKQAANDKEMNRLDVVAKDFEAMFVSEMMKPMFEGIKPDETFGGGKTEEVFKGILLQEYGKLMAETGQLGIAKHVKAELIRMQEFSVDADEVAQSSDTNENGGTPHVE